MKADIFEAGKVIWTLNSIFSKHFETVILKSNHSLKAVNRSLTHTSDLIWMFAGCHGKKKQYTQYLLIKEH